MNLDTKWLGLSLPHPFVVGASPLVDDMDTVRRLEDGGAAAVIMHSLFEEQILAEELATLGPMDEAREAYGEALDFLPMPDEFSLGPEPYLDHCRQLKEALSIPVIASLNGTTKGGWLRYGKLIQETGVDALELNFYDIPQDASQSSEDIETQFCDIVWELRGILDIPISVKLSPFFTSLPHFALKLEEAGVAGLVLFNRPFEPDYDIENLAGTRTLHLSKSKELLSRLRWCGILSSERSLDLSISGGVHTPADGIKAILSGACTVQLVSAVLEHGAHIFGTLRDGLSEWLEDMDYKSLDQARGALNLSRCPNPEIYKRANYIHLLQSWRGVLEP